MSVGTISWRVAVVGIAVAFVSCNSSSSTSTTAGGEAGMGSGGTAGAGGVAGMGGSTGGSGGAGMGGSTGGSGGTGSGGSGGSTCVPTMPIAYDVGSGPYSIVSADFNGDGKLDLATANSGSDNVSVMINQGNGQFLPPTQYAAGAMPIAIAAADLNGDGRPDFAVGFDGGGVKVFINQGDGTFAPAVAYSAGPTTLAIALADVNADSKPDIIAANWISGGGYNTVSVLLNLDNGAFGNPTSYNGGFDNRGVAVGDLNGDTLPDIAIGCLLDSVKILINQGGGVFADATAIGNPDDSATNVAIGDLNNDGQLDIVTGNQNWLNVLLNQGSGIFATTKYICERFVGACCDARSPAKPPTKRVVGRARSGVRGVRSEEVQNVPMGISVQSAWSIRFVA